MVSKSQTKSHGDHSQGICGGRLRRRQQREQTPAYSYPQNWQEQAGSLSCTLRANKLHQTFQLAQRQTRLGELFGFILLSGICPLEARHLRRYNTSKFNSLIEPLSVTGLQIVRAALLLQGLLQSTLIISAPRMLQVPHREHNLASTKAVILVGGPSRGTRFRPLSLDIPKPLFEVAGHPIIWHALKALAKVPGLREVYLVGYYDEIVFRDFIKDSHKEFPHLRIQYLREYQALGTAGGLYHFRDAILKGKPERFFVLNADVCCSFPLLEMLKLFEEKDAEAVILGTRVSNEAATNFGCIVSDSHTKRVLHYVEKPESHISNLINCGVYLFATECIFPSIRSAIKRRTTRPRLVSYPSSENLESSFVAEQEEDAEKPEVLRLEQDILSDLADSNRFFVHETKDFWRQIKTAGSAVPANALYLQKAFQAQSDELTPPSASIVPPVYIHPTATVDPTAKLGPNVSIGPRAVIGAGARVKESIVLEDAEIKHDACVLYSIIGWSSRVGAWARVEGSPTPVGSHSTSIIKNGVKVQSITILGKECVVGDEVRVQNCVCLPYKELKRDVANEVIM
ncbi:Mannose-1-phosphate guanylyltransferase [Rasamsonia emersonii CBS 393.64]|uniref:Mannose-1-phosphate guanyltransferase n=1 Tax=Rasamsonia emersonii (strain ATCC 16479 / CBS 393.64 / IMI 116815) TaxID=1408163 RepID=A0A0F4Z620_RASE3|nr:Mannose-1-phosphate guanylyltransferase [Rasamsonia emersonii CBS 393.64]KKA25765.1 Mannose-1-phosphate guanylyltransferase [Rasamsonia emersonii CBS 393.64]